jgi:putative membrane protein
MTADHLTDWGAMSGFMWVGMLIWAILRIAVIALVIVGILWLMREGGQDSSGRRRRQDRIAIAELELRYARGEVDRETFLAVGEDLERDEG